MQTRTRWIRALALAQLFATVAMQAACDDDPTDEDDDPAEAIATIQLTVGASTVTLKCAVERRVFLVGANPTQRLSLPLVAARAIHGGNDMG